MRNWYLKKNLKKTKKKLEILKINIHKFSGYILLKATEYKLIHIKHSVKGARA